MKMIKRICFIAIILLACLSIKAYANELSLECQESINPSEQNTLEVTLKGNLTTVANSVKVRYKFSEGIELESFVPNEDWEIQDGGYLRESGVIVNSVNGDVSGEVELGTFKLTVPSTYNKKTLTIRLFKLDATNTNCDVIDFNEEEVIKKVTNVIGVVDEPVEEESSNGGEQNNNNNNNNNEQNQSGSNSNNTESSSTTKTDSSKGSAKSKDTTTANSKFGQFGDKSIILVVIISIIVSVVCFKKFNALRKNIK